MCDRIESNNCIQQPGPRPTICVKDISKAQKPFLNIDVNAGDLITEADGPPDFLLAGNMAQIGVKYVNLDPCCTSSLSFASSGGLVSFLIPQG